MCICCDHAYMVNKDYHSSTNSEGEFEQLISGWCCFRREIESATLCGPLASSVDLCVSASSAVN